MTTPFSRTANIPKLLVTSNEGVLLVDTNGESSRFLANPRIDLSSGERREERERGGGKEERGKEERGMMS